DRRIVKERAARLRAAVAARLQAFCATLVGTRQEALVERQGLGRTSQFVPVMLDHGQPGEIVELTITGATANRVSGRAIRDAA
ncbi:MAG: tRNA (N(6)-L-threonylcarbamoyladenosine(37)-C(2))-methylthiotransferase MtaB, partial [Cucumibacter sp.]